MSKRNLLILLIVLLIFIPWIFGVFVSAAERGHNLGGSRSFFSGLGRFPDNALAAIRQVRNGSDQVINNAFGTCGAQLINDNFQDDNFVLVSAFDPEYRHSTIELIRIIDGELMHRWVPPVEREELSGPEDAPGGRPILANMRFFHPELLEDGAIVFCGSPGPLVKLNKDSEIEWVLKGVFHHSVEVDSDGNIWTCGFVLPSRFDSLVPNDIFEENTIVKVSPQGEILYEKSVSDILIENQLQGILFGSGPIERDPMHLNDVQPALSDGLFWRKNDLLLSVRNKSLLLLYRPTENKVIWQGFGDWINQHDADFVDSTRISVFGNDMVRIPFGADKLFNSHNDVYFINLNDSTVNTPYTSVLKKLSFATVSEGLVEMTESGELLVEDSNNGRLIIADSDGLRWSYTRCVGKNSLSILSWSRYVKKEKAGFLMQSN